MGQVSINIRGRQYQIACDDGQEAHLARLGRYLDQRAEQQMAASRSSVGDSLLLVMVALIVADELADVTAELENLKAGGSGKGKSDPARDAAENAAAASIAGMAERIERLAARLEGV